ncbi:hypothetical protein D4764_22G0002990 [Takifugu flavidus]|uniref:Uncharacterized protein n=1 Tax=Takifugu flavidus TaxID=433684 RepID=A0A5C6NAX4_9TELE|nr:hypothetical protein D4764_22G0002990 [Takifugu flavidus]
MFNTIVPHRLVSKVGGLVLNPSLCRPQVLQRPFYTTAVKSVHTGSTTPRYGSCTNVDWKALHKVIHCAQHTPGTTLPTLQDFYTRRGTTRAREIFIKDIHLAINLQWLPSGSPLRSCMVKTGRLMKS